MKILLGIFLIFFPVLIAVDRTVDISKSGMNYFEYVKMTQMENIVNSKTPGYKELIVTPIYDEVSKKIILEEKTRFATGPFINTGKQLDFILEDSGFFMVLDANGKIYYTRDGRFEMNRDMELVTVSGKLRLLSVDGSPVEIAEFTKIKIDSQGYLYDQEGAEIAQLSIVQVPNLYKLKSVNQAFFYLLPEDEAEVIEAESISLKQGFIEGSNVDYMKLLVKMADTTKYSANTQMIQTRLKMIDTIIELAKQN